MATYVGSITGSATSGSSITLDLTALTGGAGSAVQAGDLIVLACGWSSNAAGLPAPSTSGYAEVVTLYENDTRDAVLAAWYKVAGGTPDTSVSVNTRANAGYGSGAIAQVWRGVGFLHGNHASATGTNSALPDAPSVPVYTPNGIALAIGLGTGDTTPTDFTVPSGYSNQAIVKQAGTTSSAILAIASKALTTETTEDPAAWTGGESTTSDSWCAVTMALMPYPSIAWLARSTVAVVRGSGGTPGTLNRSTVAAVIGGTPVPGYIGRSTVCAVIDASDIPVTNYPRTSIVNT